MGINFEKRLWEEFNIRYGKEWVDYEPYPRQWKTRGIRTDRKEEKIVPITMSCRYHESLKSWYVQIEKGGVTGYESAEIHSLHDRGGDWSACAGGMGWNKLLIKKGDLIPMLREMKEFYKLGSA